MTRAGSFDHLTRWLALNRSRIPAGGADRIATVSTATRVPGTYSFARDGTNDHETPVTLGNYFVCIEAARAREHGPYQLIREACETRLQGVAVPEFDAAEDSRGVVDGGGVGGEVDL